MRKKELNMDKLQCQICNRKFKNYIGLSNHIARTHKLKPKVYYDLFFKKGKEGICKLSSCKNPTVLGSIKEGYRECCSIKCSNNLPERLEASRIRTTKLWENKDFRNKMVVMKTEHWKNKEFRKLMTTPGTDFRKEQGKKIKKLWNEPEYREKQIIKINEVWENPESRENHSIKMKKVWENSDLIKLRSEQSKAMWKVPELRNQIIESLKLKAQDKEYIEEKRQTSLKIAEDLEWRKRVSVGTIEGWNKVPYKKEEQRQHMLNGGAAYANSFISNPSKPQVELFKLVNELCPYPIMNYPCLNFSIDIAIPKLSIAIEYDGSYWHQDKEYDNIRQLKLEQEGWKFLRYVDYVPSKQELLNDINIQLGI